MSGIETSKRTARVPILGDDGRISDDYVPASIPASVEAAEGAQAAAEAAQAAAEAASESVGGYATSAATSASEAAESAASAATSAASAAESASAAATSATEAAASAASVEDAYIEGATATTLEAGSAATATVENRVLRLGIPRGETGAAGEAATVSVGGVSTLPAGSAATVENAGTPGAAVLDFGIPQGEKGDTGDTGEAATVTVGTVTTGEPGTEASVTNSGTPGAAVLDFVIPRGERGETGGVSEVVATEDSGVTVTTEGGVVTIGPGASAGNVLVATTEEEYVATGADAYPQPPRQTRLTGRTWVNRFLPINGTSNGVTVATDEDGLITVSGEVEDAEAGVSVLSDILPMEAGTTLTLMKSRASDQSFSVVFVDDTGAQVQEGTAATTDGVTVTAPEGTAGYRCYVYRAAGGSITTGTFRVMLVDGDEAPDCFVPYGLSSAKPTALETTGRGLLELGDASGSRDGVTYTVSGGVITASGTATAIGSRVLSEVTLPPGTYTTSLVGDTVENATTRVFDAHAANNESYVVISPTWTSATTKTYMVGVSASAVGDVVIENGHIQLELGDTATDWEAPTLTTTALPDVELRSLPDGTADELVISQDGTARVIRRTAHTESFVAGEYEGDNYWSTGTGLAEGDEVVYEAEETVEELGAVTLPELPATFCELADSDVPVRVEVTYVQDVQAVVDGLVGRIEALEAAQ